MAITLEDIAQRLEALEQAVSSLYLPTPSVAEGHRPRKPIDCRRKTAILRQDPNHVEIQGDKIWESPSLETGGFTHQNALIAITVFSDSITPNLGWQPLFTAELQGACGSPWAPLDSFTVVSGGGTGTFNVRALIASSDSLEIRVVLYAADNVDWVAPAPGRVIDFSVDGVLIAGYEM